MSDKKELFAKLGSATWVRDGTGNISAQVPLTIPEQKRLSAILESQYAIVAKIYNPTQFEQKGMKTVRIDRQYLPALSFMKFNIIDEKEQAAGRG